MTQKQTSQELLLFIKLISFFKKMRHQRDASQTHFVLVNDLYQAIPYRQCVTWLYDGQKVDIKIASGQADISQRSPYAQFLKSCIEERIKSNKLNSKEHVDAFFEEQSYAKTMGLSAESFSHCDPVLVKEWLSPFNACTFLRNSKGVFGGVWYERDAQFSDMEIAILDDVGDAFSFSLQSYQKQRSFLSSGGLFNGKIKKFILLLLLVFALWPVRYSMTVNTEIVSKSVEAVSVPYNGLIDAVLVRPNQYVKKGEVLFSLDKVGLENDYNIAQQELITARQRLEKTERETFGDASKRSELRVLREQIKLKKIEVDYAEQKLMDTRIVASKAGMVLFSDKSDLLGQPIQAGQQVMILADPQDVELLLRLPSDSIIDIDSTVDVKFFLNTSPLTSHRAELYTISYRPAKSPDGFFGYSARAKIKDKENIGRVGLMGTAKVYGGRTIMVVSILRRPLLGLRNLISF